MCTLALSHELQWNDIGYEGAFLCVLTGDLGSSEGHELSLVTAEVYYLLLFRKVHLPFLINSYKTRGYYFFNCLLLKGHST